MSITWSREARTDQQRIWLFLADRDPAFADRCEARVEQRVWQPGALPRLGRSLPSTALRRLSITDVQYIVDYEIIEEDEVVLVHRVRSTRENREEQ